MAIACRVIEVWCTCTHALWRNKAIKHTWYKGRQVLELVPIYRPKTSDDEIPKVKKSKVECKKWKHGKIAGQDQHVFHTL